MFVLSASTVPNVWPTAEVVVVFPRGFEKGKYVSAPVCTVLHSAKKHTQTSWWTFTRSVRSGGSMHFLWQSLLVLFGLVVAVYVLFFFFFLSHTYVPGTENGERPPCGAEKSLPSSVV